MEPVTFLDGDLQGHRDWRMPERHAGLVQRAAQATGPGAEQASTCRIATPPGNGVRTWAGALPAQRAYTAMTTFPLAWCPSMWATASPACANG